MGFLGNLFGRKEKTEARPGQLLVSKALGNMEQNEFSSRTCQYAGCSRTCMVPSVRLRLHTSQIESWHLDVGGYCPGCREYHCHRHLHLWPDPREPKDPPYVITCHVCDSPVVSQPDPREEAMAYITLQAKKGHRNR